jgi:glyoxylase-like metal-dependent hydrolase (beta-lactamase superfamily II)
VDTVNDWLEANHHGRRAVRYRLRDVDQILEGINKLTDKPIKFLVDTHSDGDHIWGNQFFPPGITIVAHENCQKEFFHEKRDGSPSDWNDPKLASFLPAVTYKDKMDLYLGSKKVELWHFGVGHTKGIRLYIFPRRRSPLWQTKFS